MTFKTFKTIDQLNPAALPLTGAEPAAVIQPGGTVQATVADINDAGVLVVAAVRDTNVALTGTPVADGYQTVVGDVLLLVGQTAANQNGPWVVATTAWARPANFGTATAARIRSAVVLAGTAYGGTTWVLTASGAVTIDTTAQTWRSVTVTEATARAAADALLVPLTDARLSDQRVPTDGSVNDAKVSAISEAKVTGLVSDLASKQATIPPGTYAQGLVATAVKTAPYTAAPKDYVLVDATAGSIAVTLPTAPADGTRLGIKMVATSGSNVVTFACGGSDHLNLTTGPTSGTVTLLNQAVILQYASASAVWTVQSSDLPLSQLDTRFVATAALGQAVSGTIVMTQPGPAASTTAPRSLTLTSSAGTKAPLHIDFGASGTPGPYYRLLSFNFPGNGFPGPITSIMGDGSIQSGAYAIISGSATDATAWATYQNGTPVRSMLSIWMDTTGANAGDWVATASFRSLAGQDTHCIQTIEDINAVNPGGLVGRPGNYRFVLIDKGDQYTWLTAHTDQPMRATNYERAHQGWDVANSRFLIATEAGGTGVRRTLSLNDILYVNPVTSRVGIGIAVPLYDLDVLANINVGRTGTVGTLQLGGVASGNAPYLQGTAANNLDVRPGSAGLRCVNNAVSAVTAFLYDNANFALGGNGSFGGGVKCFFISNATTVPTSNPTGGGVVYVESGALKYRGSSGTVTVLGPA